MLHAIGLDTTKTVSEFKSAEVLGVNGDGEEDDTSETQVVPSGEKAQLLKQMLPMLHDLHSIGAKLDDTVIKDMARNLCIHICNSV